MKVRGSKFLHAWLHAATLLVLASPSAALADGPQCARAGQPTQQHAPVPRFLRMWGQSGSGPGEFDTPIGIAMSEEDLIYVTDLHNERVQVFDARGTLVRQFPVAGEPGGIALDGTGLIYLALFNKDRIAVYTDQGEPVHEFGRRGRGDGEFIIPADLAIGPSGSAYLADDVNRRIQKFSPDGKFLLKWGQDGSGPGQFGGEGTDKLSPTFRTSGPSFLAFDSQGILYATCGRGGKVHRFRRDGTFVSDWGSNRKEPGGFGGRKNGLPGPTGICIDSHDRVWVAATNNRIQLFTKDGEYLVGFGAAGDGEGEFHTPHDIALDSKGRLYVADTRNNRIQVFRPCRSSLSTD